MAGKGPETFGVPGGEALPRIPTNTIPATMATTAGGQRF